MKCDRGARFPKIVGFSDHADCPFWLSPFVIRGITNALLLRSAVGMIGAMKSFILSSAIILTHSLGGLSVVYADSATWNLNPTSGQWNTPDNWTPATVPNGPSDVATFGISNQTNVLLVRSAVVDSIVFDAGASAFTVTSMARPESGANLSFAGTGVINNSGINQTFVTQVVEGVIGLGSISFFNEATAGSSTTFINSSGPTGFQYGGITDFFDSSTAGNATIVNEGSPAFGQSGRLEFRDNTSAANSFILNHGGTDAVTGGGETDFYDSSTADQVTAICNGGEADGAGGGVINFWSNSTAANGNFTVNGGAGTNSFGGAVDFFADDTNAGSATFTINGGTAPNANGGSVSFRGERGMYDGALIANGGSNGGLGGTIYFAGQFQARRTPVEVYGNGALDISGQSRSPFGHPGARIGSLAGDGLVYLGGVVLEVGRNNLDTSFSGTMQDGGGSGGTGGSFTKIGTGTLTLSGANIYTGGTTLSEGALVINNTIGSGTGDGAVQVNQGTLAGSGTVSGAVTVGTGGGLGAFLAPGKGASTATTFTIQSALTFKADAIYTCSVNTRRVEADQVIANGVTIENGAQFKFASVGNKTLTPGTVFIVISNTFSDPIAGNFANLPDDSTFTVGPNNFQVSYEGGDGNDLTLTVVL